uniref:centrin-3-like isoform X9 n=1 Tax=Myxine glutinosa TaxID=7769 RepID=UPI00358E67ED
MAETQRPDMADDKEKRRRRKELTEEQKLEVKEAFDLFDTDQDGTINYRELKVAMRALGFDVKKAEILKILNDYDRGNTGKMAFVDFMEVMTEKLLTRDPTEELARAFRLFDESGTGHISLRDLRRVTRELGEDVPDEELRSMIDEFDTDGDGYINEEEFKAIMTGDL